MSQRNYVAMFVQTLECKDRYPHDVAGLGAISEGTLYSMSILPDAGFGLWGGPGKRVHWLVTTEEAAMSLTAGR